MEAYRNLSRKKLIVFSIAKVINTEEECTFERLVKECFDRFPKSFSFTRYPHWPDSLKLDRSLRTLRNKDGFIKGNNSTHFTLTASGKKFATAVAKELSSGLVFKKTPSGGKKRKEERILEELRNMKEFKTFKKQGQKMSLNEPQIRYLAFSTLETPLEEVVDKLRKLRNLAHQADLTTLEKFLSYCQKIISHG